MRLSEVFRKRGIVGFHYGRPKTDLRRLRGGTIINSNHQVMSLPQRPIGNCGWSLHLCGKGLLARLRRPLCL